ncbi:hypothetical protein AgCh_000552 [Apium graveolens]
MTHFKALNNQEPVSLNNQLSTATNPGVKKFLQDRSQVQQLLEEILIKSQERMKWYSNKKKSDSLNTNSWIPKRQQACDDMLQVLDFCESVFVNGIA